MSKNFNEASSKLELFGAIEEFRANIQAAEETFFDALDAIEEKFNLKKINEDDANNE